MNNIRHQGILVKLLKKDRTILMRIRDKSDYDCDPTQYSVVFADPDKWRTYMQPWADLEHYHSDKHKKCQEAFLRAEVTHVNSEPLSDAHYNIAIPLPIVDCFFSGKAGSFSDMDVADGKTRSIELLKCGAEFVPLEVKSKHAEILHNLVGGNQSPKPAIEYLLPSDIRVQGASHQERPSILGPQKLKL